MYQNRHLATSGTLANVCCNLNRCCYSQLRRSIRFCWAGILRPFFQSGPLADRDSNGVKRAGRKDIFFIVFFPALL